MRTVFKVYRCKVNTNLISPIQRKKITKFKIVFLETLILLKNFIIAVIFLICGTQNHLSKEKINISLCLSFLHQTCCSELLHMQKKIQTNTQIQRLRLIIIFDRYHLNQKVILLVF